ncbi:hypothetical protein TrST_g2562 [Triparma strigata]|uniref:Uncharacterized protein n=1 Tax=Triparma strigata TaxID=1606541 RepID=A0A9W7AJL2_9STRA|nr:hypothetical protein TrST_g2562 [Triparma strigata]
MNLSTFLLLGFLLLFLPSLSSFSPSPFPRSFSPSSLSPLHSSPPPSNSNSKKRKRKRKSPPPPEDVIPASSDVGPALKAVDLPSIQDSFTSKSTLPPPEEEESKFSSVSRADSEGLKLLLQSDPTAFDPSQPSLPSKKGSKKDKQKRNSGDFTTVSLLLGEGGSSFFSIPFQAVQVGHGILSVILLLSLIDYPGFPLTNLPPVYRESIGESLLAVYGVNVLMAGWVFFGESGRRRGQKGRKGIWAVKTVAVGGLALGQLRNIELED